MLPLLSYLKHLLSPPPPMGILPMTPFFGGKKTCLQVTIP
jgi:hypothetical protein